MPSSPYFGSYLINGHKGSFLKTCLFRPQKGGTSTLPSQGLEPVAKKGIKNDALIETVVMDNWKLLHNRELGQGVPIFIVWLGVRS